MTDSEKYKGSFYGAPVDYRDEYVQARKLMGLKSTDMDALLHTVGFLYLYCPEDIRDAYASLIEEITERQSLMVLKELFENV